MEGLHHRLGSAASAHPHRIALVDEPRRIAYGPLWDQARAFAAALQSLGMEPGQRLAIVLPNCIEAVVACYGGWIAGAVVVPLNVQARARDLGQWLSHCGAAAVACAAVDEDLAQALREMPLAPACLVVDADAGPSGFRTGATPIRDSEAAVPGTALILYTSGTTGDPKGVTLTHANLLANVAAVIDYLALSANDSVLSPLPFYYAYGASVLHTHLVSGARVVLARNLLFPHQLMEQACSERVTGLSGVPSTYALLLDRVALGDYDLSSLRYLTQAGGAMPAALAKRLHESIPHARLFLMYGQTEATSRLTWLPPDRFEQKAGSVGIPVDGTALKIMAEDGSQAGVGEHGEVWAKGPGVMPGYWKNPEASASVLQHGWLRTGDLGFLDEDGFLFLLGRRSDMIKTGAHRVHPNDIEQVIAELPWVSEVAVVGTHDEMLGQAIKALVVVAPGAIERADAAIKAHCRTQLAPYKVPRYVEFVDSLPRTASGKVRRTQLMEQKAKP